MTLKQLLDVMPSTQAIRVELSPFNFIYMGYAENCSSLVFTSEYIVKAFVVKIDEQEYVVDGMLECMTKTVIDIKVELK